MDKNPHAQMLPKMVSLECMIRTADKNHQNSSKFFEGGG